MTTNVELVQEAYAAFGRGDIPAILGMLTDDVVFHSPETLVHGGTYKGGAEVLEFFQGIGGAWDGLNLDIEAVEPLGADQVVGLVQANGTRRSTNHAEGYGATHVFTVRGGKITRFREYVDIDAPIG